MNIEYKNFLPEKIPDNDWNYLLLVESAISSVDYYSIVRIEKFSDSYYFRITLSENSLTNVLIEQLNNMNKLMGVRYDYGKSLKKGNIFFKTLSYTTPQK